MSYAITESADTSNLPMAKEIAEALEGAYPDYCWHVRIDGGLLIIKSMKISSVWSMAVPFHKIAHDAGARKREVVMKAGEFLEAANLRRGKHREGEYANTLEGRKDKGKFHSMNRPRSMIVN